MSENLNSRRVSNTERDWSAQEKLTREELLVENKALFEEMDAMEIQHEETLTAAVTALEKTAREKRALERQIADLQAAKDLHQIEKQKWNEERARLRGHIEVELKHSECLFIGQKELSSEHRSLSQQTIAAHGEREAAKQVLVAVEGETARLLDWLIKEGRLLEGDDDVESDTDEDTEDIKASSNSNNINDINKDINDNKNTSNNTGNSSNTSNTSNHDINKDIEDSNKDMPSPNRPRRRIGSQRLGESASLSTLFAAAVAGAGTVTHGNHKSHSRLVSNTSISNNNINSTTASNSIDNVHSSTNNISMNRSSNNRKRDSSLSHLSLSVCSLSKLSEGKLPSSSAHLDARILAQLAKISELLKAILALQEATSKQLFGKKKRVKLLEAELVGLRAWRECVVRRVGEANADKVPFDNVKNPREDADPLDLTRNILKRIQAMNRSADAFLLKCC